VGDGFVSSGDRVRNRKTHFNHDRTRYYRRATCREVSGLHLEWQKRMPDVVCVYDSKECLACIVQAGGDPIDGRAQRILQIRGFLSALLAAQQFHLNQAHGVDVWVAQADGTGEHAIAA
jgi:hypothetical protein